MSSHSGTIGRSSGRSITANGAHIRRQRSVEWHHAQGYSSSDDDQHHGTINPSFDSHLLAQLIAQSQELSNKCEYKFNGYILCTSNIHSSNNQNPIWIN